MARRIVMWIAIGLAFFGGFLVLSGAAVYHWGRTDSGRAWLGARLAGILSAPGTRAVAIGRLDGDPFDAFRLESITVSDRAGVWLRIDSAEVRWRPWALLRGQVWLERLHADTARLIRIPERDGAPPESTSLPETIRGLQRYRLDEGGISTLALEPAILGEKPVLQVRMSLGADEGASVRSFLEVSRRDGNDGRAAVKLVTAPGGESLDLSVEIDEPANGLIANALDVPGLPPLHVRVGGRGPLAAWEGSASLTFESFATLSATFALRNGAATAFEVAGESVLLDGATGGGKPGWRVFLGDRAEWRVAGTADPEWQRLNVAQARIAGGFGALTGSGRYDSGRGEGRAAVALREHDLSLLALPLNTPLAGHAALEADVEIKKHGHTVAARLHGEADNVATGQAALDRLLTPTPQISGRLDLTPETLTLADFAVNSEAVTLKLNGTLKRNGWVLDTAYRLEAPSGVTVPVSDGVDIDCRCVSAGKIAGALADPHVSGSIGAGALRAAGVHLKSPSLSFRVRGLTGATEGLLEATAETALGPLAGHAGLKRSGNQWRLAGLHAEAGRAVLDGDLAIPTDNGPIDGALKLALPTLSPWLGLASLAGDGTGELRATFRRNGMRQAVAIDGAFSDLRIEGGEADSPITADRLAVNAETRDLAAGKPFTATLDLGALTIGEARIRQVRARIGGSTARVSVNATAEGNWNGPVSLKSRFALAPVQDGLRVDVSGFDGRILNEAFRLTETSRLIWKPGRMEVGPLALSFGKARLAGRLHLREDSVDALIAVDGLPLDLTDRFWHTRLAGTTTGRFELQGTRAAPTGTLTATVAALRLPEQPIKEGLSVSVNGRWAKGRLAIDGEVPGIGDGPSRFAADIPLGFAETGWEFVMPVHAPVSGSLSWHGDAAKLWRFVPLAEHELAGPSVVDLRLRGSVGRPELHGSIAVSKGRYESLELGTVLKDLDLRIAIDGLRATVTRFAARDGNGGRASLTGGITLDAVTDYPFDLKATFKDFMVLRRDEFEAAASGGLQFKGTFRTAAIDGRLETERAEIRVLERLPPDVVELDVTEIANASGNTGSRPQQQPRAFDPALAITIAMPRRVFVRGRGLDSEWKGQLVLGGTVGAPQLRGELEIVRGQVSVIGKAFRLERGVVLFPDRPNASPTLDITAVHEGRRITAQAQIEGPVRNPKVTLTSTPSLPPDEIVSQILFDKGASHLSGVEAAQLAIALAQLSGKGGVAGNAMEFARKTLGVDVLQLEETRTVSGERAAAVRAGKYLSKDIYVGVKQGATSESSSVGVEVEVTPNIIVESEVRPSGESDTSIKFKLDY